MANNKDRFNNRHHQPINNTTEEVVEELREEDPFMSKEEVIENEDSITTVTTTSNNDEPITISIEQKNEEVVTSGYIEVVEDNIKEEEKTTVGEVKVDDNKKKIEELKNKIEEYQKEMDKCRNNTINAFYHDKIMEARKEITRLSSTLPPTEVHEATAPAVSDRVVSRQKLQQENVNNHIIRII